MQDASLSIINVNKKGAAVLTNLKFIESGSVHPKILSETSKRIKAYIESLDLLVNNHEEHLTSEFYREHTFIVYSIHPHFFSSRFDRYVLRDGISNSKIYDTSYCLAKKGLIQDKPKIIIINILIDKFLNKDIRNPIMGNVCDLWLKDRGIDNDNPEKIQLLWIFERHDYFLKNSYDELIN